MPFRTKHTYSTSRGTYNTRKHSFTGSGPAPAGMHKAPTPTINDVAVTTTYPSGRSVTTAPGRAPVSTSPPSPSLSLLHLNDLLTPGPMARETAEAAHRLGVKPKSGGNLDLGAVGDAAQAISHTVAQGVDAIAKDVQAVKRLPRKRVEAVSGRKTLGKPTLGQLLGAAVHHQVKVNQRGKLTIPATRQAARGLQQARRRVSVGGAIQGPLTPDQRQFGKALVNLTHLSPKTIGGWLLAEDSDEAARSKEASGDANLLNIGPGYDLGANPKAAARQTAQLINTGPSYGGIRASAGAGVPAQVAAIRQSPWDGAHYPNGIPTSLVSTRPVNPKAVAQLQQAKRRAAGLGIPTKAGDVERGPQPKTVLVRADAKGMVDWAKALLGTQEGSRLQVKWANRIGISPAEPWCSEFIAAGLARRGLPAPSNPAYSGTWLEWKGGRNIGTDLRQAKPGDIVVFGPAGATSHVGLYVGGGRMISGNWSNEVAEANVSEDSNPVVGIVRPLYHGGKVAVQESTPLPGGAIAGGQAVAAPAGLGAGGVVGPSRPASTAVGGSGAPVSPLLAVAASLPAAYQQFQEGEPPLEAGPRGKGIIGEILRRKRL